MIALLVLLIALVHPSLGSFWNQGSFWDQKSDNCYYALRHRGTPSVDMFLKMQQWGTSDIWKGLELENMIAMHILTGARRTRVLMRLGPNLYKDGGTPKCEICYKGLCNKAKIELQKPLLKNVQKPNIPPKTGTDGAKNESSFEQNGMMTGAKNESSSKENGTGGAKNASSSEENGTGGAKNASSSEENGTGGAKNASSSEENGTGGAKNASSSEENGTGGAKNASSSEENGTTTGAKDESSSTPAD
ncbi:hypothetical protein GPALN_013276 [Globodera pallida]|nr:hypothetical protein GPALN_013276 [Globodera pallida]